MVSAATPESTHARIRKAMRELETEDGDRSHRIKRAAPAIMAAKPEHLPESAASILSDLQRGIFAAQSRDLTRSDYLALLSQLRAVQALIDYQDQKKKRATG
jgi:hypothetical protein